MSVRIKDWMIPYTGGIGIEITNNHVINVLLRELNNLIHVNENRELYVDLQLDDWIQPDDDFPVGVTTWKILQEDWWQQSGLILNWKTTSWDYNRLIYANDWNLYIDLWDWVWILLGWSGIIENLWNCKAFFIRDLSETTEGQNVVDWYLDWKYPIVVYRNESYILEASPTNGQIRFYSIHPTVWNGLDVWTSYTATHSLYATWDVNNQFQRWMQDEVIISPVVIAANRNYNRAFMPTQDWDPTSKKYVDDELATKQDILIAWNNITIWADGKTISANNTTYTAWQHISIQNWVISADISWALIYRWNVSDYSDLANIQNPSQWDTYFVENDNWMYSYDGTQWNYVGWVGVNLNDYFNKINDTSDDITEWSTNLFTTQNEKDTWNAKQDQIIAWNNITINADWKTINAVDTTYSAWQWISINSNNEISATPYTEWNWIDITNNVISNEAPFDPDNQWAVGQVLTKTSDWYQWKNPISWVTSVNGRTWAVTVDEFQPDNAGTTGQVLKKTNDGYEWLNETAGSYTGWDWIIVNQTSKTITNSKPFAPWNTWNTGQVLKKTSSWYEWANESWGWGWWGGGWVTSVNWRTWAVTVKEVPSGWSNGQVLTKTTNWYDWATFSANANVKLFTLSSTSDLTTAQSAVDWLNNGNMPILKYHGTFGATPKEWDYFFYPVIDSTSTATHLLFTAIPTNNQYTVYSQQGITQLEKPVIEFNLSNGSVTSIVDSNLVEGRSSFLSTNVDYTTTYIPQYDWSPATKKYVDDHDTVVSGDSGTTYTIKVSNSNPPSWTANNVITIVL